MKQAMLATSIVAAGLFCFGCQDQNAAKDSDLVYAEQEQDSGNPLEALAFWKWFEGDDEITAADVRADMSPALMTVGSTQGEVDNAVARTLDTNSRQVWNDLGRILLLDRPSRSSSYPIP